MTNFGDTLNADPEVLLGRAIDDTGDVTLSVRTRRQRPCCAFDAPEVPTRRLVTAAVHLAQSRQREAALRAELFAMPKCERIQDYERAISAYSAGAGLLSSGANAAYTACYRATFGDQRLLLAQWCQACQARQPLFEAIAGERRKRGGFQRAIIAAGAAIAGSSPGRE